MKIHKRVFGILFIMMLGLILVACGGNNDKKVVADAKAALAIEYTSPDTATSVTKDVKLPASVGDVAVTWASDKTSSITASGKVFRTNADVAVKLTATLTKGEVVDTKEFALTVLGNVVPTGNTYLAFTDDSWGVSYWSVEDFTEGVVATSADVNAYGTYTVGLDFSGTENGKAVGLNIAEIIITDGEKELPGTYINIDSIKVNGQAVPASNSFTFASGFDTKTSIANPYVEKDEETEQYSGRVGLDANSEGLEADILKAHYGADYKTVEIVSLEVTFTYGLGVAVGSTVIPEEGLRANLIAANGSWTVMYMLEDAAGVEAEDAIVTGYGQYSASVDFTGTEAGKLDKLAFFGLQIQNGDSYFSSAFVRIDEFKINGQVVALENYYSDVEIAKEEDVVVAKHTRVNLFNDWAPKTVLKGRVEKGVAETELDVLTPVPLDVEAYQNITKMEVTFTIVGGFEFELDPPYEVPATFKGFIMFASEDESWSIFKATGTDSDNSEITGDGTYTITLTKENILAGGGSAEGAVTGAKVFLIDIEGLGKAMKHEGTLTETGDKWIVTEATVTVKIWIDGVEIAVNQNNILIGDIEDNGRFRIELFNEYGTGTKEKPVVNPADVTPENEIKIEFTITGTGVNVAE